MRTHRFLFAPLVLAIAACGQASAATPDPTNDVDCSVLAFYFKGLGEHTGAPAAQQRSLDKVHGWYAVKLQAINQAQGPAAIQARGEPLLEAVKKAPLSMTDAHMACAKRAIGEGLR